MLYKTVTIAIFAGCFAAAITKGQPAVIRRFFPFVLRIFS
jgi:hypothetical protein